jgi:integrase/recombinase XerD
MDYQTAREKLTQDMLKQGFVAHTKKKYQSVFRNFYEFAKVTSTIELTQEMAKAFLSFKLLSDKISGGTLRNFEVALRYIFQSVVYQSTREQPKAGMVVVFAPLEGAVPVARARILMIQAMEFHGLSQVTQTRYLRFITIFAESVGADDLRKITIHDVKNFIYNEAVVKQKSPSSCNCAIVAIKGLFIDVLQKEWVDGAVKYFKLPSRLPIVLSIEDTNRLIIAITDPMHRMVAILMYSAGLRVSEAVSIRICDIKRATMQIFIHQGKGRKDRYAVLSENCLKELEKYYRSYRPTNYFFPSMLLGNLHISKHTIQDAVSLAAEKCGFKNVTSHTLRHCFATHLVQNGINPFSVKDALGHASLKTTSIYVNLANTNGINIKSPYDL